MCGPAFKRGIPAEAESWDCVVIGAGAAGLLAAAHAATPFCRVLVLDGAARLGAKILISGGGRCNVTNAVVTARDFNGGPSRIVSRVLAAWPVSSTVQFFAERGVTLREEARGKLFPETGRARTVLDALVDAATRAGAVIRTSWRVEGIERVGGGLLVRSARGLVTAPRVVLATGGRSVPRTGSDGAGYAYAEALGHAIVPTTPALVPLVLGDGWHEGLAGVSQDVEARAIVHGQVAGRARGPLLWTHVGISGPAALDISRHLLRGRLETGEASLRLALRPGLSFDEIDAALVREGAARPRATAATIVAAWMPQIVAARLARASGIAEDAGMAHLSRRQRRALAHLLHELPLDAGDSRGYAVAEATAGGVALTEVDPATMASKRCPGFYLAGEVLDVDGRLGGFNFQWAFASGAVAGRAVARACAAQSE
jgi:predicted Rossmann fold flavoprotein